MPSSVLSVVVIEVVVEVPSGDIASTMTELPPNVSVETVVRLIGLTSPFLSALCISVAVCLMYIVVSFTYTSPKAQTSSVSG